MSDSIFDHSHDVFKLGGDNTGQNLTAQQGLGGDAQHTGHDFAQNGLAAVMGGGVLQESRQIATGGAVGDTENHNSSVVVLNIS